MEKFMQRLDGLRETSRNDVQLELFEEIASSAGSGGAQERQVSQGTSPTASTIEASKVVSPDREVKIGVLLSETSLSVVTSVMIFLNSIFIGMKVQVTIDNAKQGLSAPDWVLWVDVSFLVSFILEFLFRLAVLRLKAFAKDERVWTLFELVLIIMNVVEYSGYTFDPSVLRLLRFGRVARFTRALHDVKHVHELRLISASLLSSCRTLLWACAFLTYVLYIVAAFIAMDVTEHIRVSPHVDGHLLDLYGGIPTCMLTLYMSITGGHDWEFLMVPLQTMNEYFYVCFFVVFVFMFLFGVMNLLTGLSCNAASHVQGVDRELVIREKMDETKAVERELRALFQVCSRDGSLDAATLESQLSDPVVVNFLKFLEVDISDVGGLFQLLGCRRQWRHSSGGVPRWHAE